MFHVTLWQVVKSVCQCISVFMLVFVKCSTEGIIETEMIFTKWLLFCSLKLSSA